MIDIFLGIAGFGIMLLIQAAIINGVHIAFQGYDEIKDGKTILHGNIFYPIARWFNARPKLEWISKPIFSCVKCMASLHGSWTYWIFVLNIFGYNNFELFVWVCDVFALAYLNYLLYKKV